MIVCPKSKFLIILPARCGSTSVKEAIKERFNCKEIGPNHGAPVAPEHRPYFKACLHRNPFTRVLSLYRHWMQRNPLKQYSGLDYDINEKITKAALPFPDLVKRLNTRKLLLTVAPPVAKLTRAYRIDMWVAQENLVEDIQGLPFLGEEPLELPHRHKLTSDEPWQSAYTTKAKVLVRQLYASDFDQFGYEQEFAT